jgi:putative tryptophan/tyrosine transport system substrate-binding protein
MKRREFIAGLGFSAAWPLATLAQETRMPVIGYLNSESLQTAREYFEAFHRGLAETGYVEGRNVAMEYRWAGGQNDLVSALATDLVSRRVNVIVTNNTPTSLAVRAATQTIPTVFLVGSDPVLIGLVAALNRPGGNLTGVSILNTEVIGKRLQLLHELVPSATLIAFLANPTNPVFAGAEMKVLQAAAHILGLQLLPLDAKSPAEIEAAFEKVARERAGALVVSGDTYFISQRHQIVSLAAQHDVPAIYNYPEMAAAGGLLSYGTDIADGYRQEGLYVGRILKGDKPSELPVQQVVKLYSVLNMKAAKALGLTVPNTLLVSADRVIE